MHRAAIACLLFGVTLALPQPAVTQESGDRPNRALLKEPPGRDLFIPYLPNVGAPAAEEVRNREQLRILAEMNKLTIELVKRRSNAYATQADIPQLVKRMKQLARQLQELR